MAAHLDSSDAAALEAVAETAREIDGLVDELRRRTRALDGSAYADDLAVLAGALARVSSKLSRRCDELAGNVAEPAPAAAPEPAPAPTAAARRESAPAARAGLRIVLTELAAQGSTRAQAEAYLAEHYGVGDADALLDDVFGPVR